MKKRILLSLLSFFAMTAMWASLNENFKLYFAENMAAGKVGQKATLTLNMKNTTERPMVAWKGKIVLPEGVTYVDGSAAVVQGRYPSDYNPVITVTNEGGLVIECEGAEGITISGTDGAVATIEVEIASTVTPGDVVLKVDDVILTEPGEVMMNLNPTETLWTIEEGETFALADLNHDGYVNVADLDYVYNLIAADAYDEKADFNNDAVINVADADYILNLIAAQ